MRLLVGSKIKQEVPKSVTPALLFGVGVGVEMGHIVGSKTLIIELAKLGFKSAMMKLKDSSNQLQFNPNQKKKKIFLHFFSQCVGDNCDHNANTLDGKGVSHLMRIIECAI